VSLRKAINAKCKECIYDPYGPGGWKQQVTACSSYGCPLYTVRPISESISHSYLGKVRCKFEKMDERSQAVVVFDDPTLEGSEQAQNDPFIDSETAFKEIPSFSTDGRVPHD